MTNLSFTVDLEQDVASLPTEAGSGEGESSNQEGLAWEINFSSDKNKSPKKLVLPRFLREREQTHSDIPSSEPIKSTAKSKPPGRSSSSPMKARGPKPASRPPSKSNTSPPRASKPGTRQDPLILSPKKSPTIKKPLLPVASPTKKSARTLDLRSQSDCSLTLTTPGKAMKGKADLRSKPRPHSATSSVGGAKKDTPPKGPVQRAASADTRSGRTKSQKEPSRSLPTVTLETAEAHKRLATTSEQMAQRKIFDLKRWYCMCHPQYSKSCGISSVVSCWNYLFSVLGNGSLPALTQEDALTLLGFQPPFGEIRFGPFTGNITVMKWFQQLCEHFGVSGHSYYFYKPVGKRRTFGIKPEMALDKLQEGLKNSDMAFIYHCHNHYFCPIGYEEVPKKATDAYRVDLRADEVDTWLLIGEPSRRQAAIHCKKWTDIVSDLTCESPQYFNIRHTERGVCTRYTKKSGGNLHCIMAFKKEKIQDSISPSLLSPLVDDYDGPEITLSEIEDLDSCDSDYYLDDPKPQQILPALEIREVTIREAKEKAVDLIPAASGVRRSGTFTKEAPTVRVAVTRAQSTDSESSLDMENTRHDSGLHSDGEGESTGFDFSGLKRSGTFTIDSPTVCVQRTRASSSSEYDSADEVDDQYYEITEYGGIERSSTFTKTSSETSSRRESGDSQGTDYSSNPEDHPTATGLKRSGTFTIESHSSLPASNIPLVIDDNVDFVNKNGKELDADTVWLSIEHKTEGDFSTRLDLDLNETLKASDFANDEDMNNNNMEDTN